MAYKKGQDRRQRVLFPDCIDEYVEADAPVRLFDAFVDNLKMDELGFVRSTPAETGTPGYDPRDLLKLYIYGYFYQVRSSRKLARECKCNVEVMWLLNKLTPDFRTISDFRKDADSLKMSCNVSLVFARSARNAMRDTVIHLRKVVKARFP